MNTIGKLLKIAAGFLIYIFPCYANITGVSYVKNQIFQKYGIDIPETSGGISSVAYIVDSVNYANSALNGDIASNCSASAAERIASKDFADAWIDNKIVNCDVGHYFDCANNACKIATYKIILNPMGGVPDGSIYLKYGMEWQQDFGEDMVKITAISTPRTRSGYNWDGFYSEENCNGVKIMGNDKVLETTITALTFATRDNTTAYACWK